MSLTFFTDKNGKPYWVNSAMNVVDATRYHQANPDFLMAMLEERKKITVNMPFVMRARSAHTDTPVLDYTPYNEKSPQHNVCFHPFAYIRCNHNMARVPVTIYAYILGKSVPVEVIAKFPVNTQVASWLNQAQNVVFEKRGDALVLRVGNIVDIPCDVVAPE